MIFTKKLNNKIQISNEKYWSFLMIWLLICLVVKTLNPTVTELFIKGRKLNISPVLIIKFCFAVPKNISLNSTHCFIMKMPNKREFQQIAFNHSPDTDFKISMNLYKTCSAKPYF